MTSSAKSITQGLAHRKQDPVTERAWGEQLLWAGGRSAHMALGRRSVSMAGLGVFLFSDDTE